MPWSWAEEGRLNAFWALLVCELAMVAVFAAVGAVEHHRGDGTIEIQQRLVSRLGITDLALWSDAGYCRHPSQADLFSAHSEHPAALEHFPAGSFAVPSHALKGAGKACAKRGTLEP